MFLHIGTPYDFDLENRGLSNINKQLISFVIRFPFWCTVISPWHFYYMPPS